VPVPGDEGGVGEGVGGGAGVAMVTSTSSQFGPPLVLALGLLIARNRRPARRSTALVTVTQGADHESNH